MPIVSPLATTPVKQSPFRNPRRAKIDTITIHHMSGNCDVVSLGEDFARPSRQGSSNYGVGTDGRIACYVPEEYRAWTSSSPSNDHRAITIEVANDINSWPWSCSDKAIDALVDLLVDICQRNHIPKLLWKNDQNLIGRIDQQNMTIHKWFADTDCPGPWLHKRMGLIADRVNARLEDYMTGEQIIKELTPKQAYELLKKACDYADTLPQSKWSEDEGWFDKAKDAGIVNGKHPMGIVTQEVQTAILGRAGLIPESIMAVEEKTAETAEGILPEAN